MTTTNDHHPQTVVDHSTWDDFADAGMVGLANLFLRPFGWLIGIHTDGDYRSYFPCRYQVKTDAEKFAKFELMCHLEKAAAKLKDESETS